MSDGPRGKCQIVRVEDRKPGNKFAVFAKVIVQDENGKEFYFDTAAFLFDLKEVESATSAGKQR